MSQLSSRVSAWYRVFFILLLFLFSAVSNAGVMRGIRHHSSLPSVICEWALHDHALLDKLSLTLHDQLTTREFVYSGQAEPNPRFLADLGLPVLTRVQRDHLALTVAESVDGYRLNYWVGNGTPVLATLDFTLPPVFVWQRMSIDQVGLEEWIWQRGGFANLTRPHPDDTTQGVYLPKTASGSAAYIEMQALPEGQLTLTLGVDLDCKDRAPKGSEPRLMVRSSQGWVCRYPVLKFTQVQDGEEQAE